VFSSIIPLSSIVPTFHYSRSRLQSKSYEIFFNFSTMYNFQDGELLCALCG
jgi:hypothetical protein